MPSISFFGAAHEVTGSCHLVRGKTKQILLDCGMFQGSDYNEGKNADDFDFEPSSVDYVLVSHAHNDHSGRIPKLVKDGFRGKIITTKGTAELMRLIWDDAQKIMEYNHKKFQGPIIFTPQDINRAAGLVHGVDYKKKIDLGDGDFAMFHDAGHIFGAAFIELHIDGKIIGFSGDVGNHDAPILKDTKILPKVDVLLMESTYGDRIHKEKKERTEILLNVLLEGAKRGGTVMMPAFSLERTQEIIYHLNDLKEHHPDMPNIPVFVDSPLAIRAIPVYKKYIEYYDKEAKMLYTNGDDFLQFPGLSLTLTREESMKINHIPGAKLIIAGSGMMTGGRILHHAKRYLSDPKSTLVLVGYQAQHTLGRRLYEGAKNVKIHGEDIPVRAHIQFIEALSAHADQKKLMDWVKHAEALPKKIYCVHGEAHAATELAQKLKKDLKIPSFVPEPGETITV